MNEGRLPEDLWPEFLQHLDDAKASLHRAFLLMDGWEGFTDEAGAAIVAAFEAIETVRTEEVSARSED